MWREWCAVIYFCLSVSIGAGLSSVHHKKQTNATMNASGSSGSLSGSVEAWLTRYWYVPLVAVLVLVVSAIFACACAIKKVRASYSHYRTDSASARSNQPRALPFTHPPLRSVLGGSLSPGMVSIDQSPVPSPQPSYSSQQSHRSSGRGSAHKKKRTLSPGQNSSGSEETIRSDRGMLRGSWQQKGGVPGSVVKLSINGMQEHHGVSLPEASSMLSVRSNHSGRSGHSVRSCHSHSDTSSQKTVVEVDVKLHLSPDQEQDARMMTAAALAESARQLACSAARLGEEDEHYQVFSHSPPKTNVQPRISVTHITRGLENPQYSLPPQRDISTSRVTTPLTCATISLDRAVNMVSMDHPIYTSSMTPRGKHGYLPPASPLSAHRSVGPDLKRSAYQASPHSPTRPGVGSLDRGHAHSPTRPGVGSLDRAHAHSPTRPGVGSLDRGHAHSPTRPGVGSLDRAHAHSPTRPGVGSLDRAHAHSPTRPGVGSLDRGHAHSSTRTSLDSSSNGLKQTRIPPVNSDRLPWQYNDSHSQDYWRQFYEQDTPPGYTCRASQDIPLGSRLGHHDYRTLDMDSLNPEDCRSHPSLGHYSDANDVLPQHGLTNTSQEPRVPLSLGQLSSTAKPIRMHHETVQLRLQDYSSGATEIRGTKQPSGSCAEDSGIQTTSFCEEPCQSPESPCCSGFGPSVEENHQETLTETNIPERQQSLSSADQNTPPPYHISCVKRASLPRSSSGLSMEEQLSTASGYAATGSASSIETKSNGTPSQPNQYGGEPRIRQHTSHNESHQHDITAGALQWDTSSPDLTPQDHSCDRHSFSETSAKVSYHHHSSIPNRWIQPVVKYSGDNQESISVDI